MVVDLIIDIMTIFVERCDDVSLLLTIFFCHNLFLQCL